MTVSSSTIENEFNEMVFALENTGRGGWVFAVVNHASARSALIKRLQAALKLPIFIWQYSNDTAYPIDYLKALSGGQKQQRAIVLLLNIALGGDKTIKSLDFNREKFAEYPHSLVFFITESERGEIAKKAGHFWAQRRGTFDFSQLRVNELLPSQSYSLNGWLNNSLNVSDFHDAERQLALYQSLLPEYSVEEQPLLLAETSGKIAYLLYFLGRYSEAVAFCQNTLRIRQTTLGEKHPETIASLSNLAKVYDAQGDYALALPLYQQALAISLAVLGDQHPDTANSLNNLAELYVAQGDYAQALPLYQQALAIRQAVLGGGHPDTATSLNNLAALYYAQGDYTQALPLFQQALGIRKTVHGDGHPDIANSLNNLASLYYDQGDYAQALPLYQQALDIYKAVLGDRHPDTATSLNNLASLYHGQGDYAQALPLYEQALAISQAVLGDGHPNIASSLNNLALLYKNQGNYAQALTLYGQALDIFKTVLGDGHPNTKIVKANYEKLLAKKTTS